MEGAEMKRATLPMGVIPMAVCSIAAFVLTACSPPTGNIENGQRWFTMNHCHGCHGKNGTGGPAKEIAGLDRSFGSFVRFLRSPNSSSMPDFTEEQLSEEDAADIYAWLRSLPQS